MKKETLLDKAKKIETSTRTTKTVDDEKIDLAIGWATDQITLGQFTQIVWGKKASGIGGKALYTIAHWLKAGIKKGRIKVDTKL